MAVSQDRDKAGSGASDHYRQCTTAFAGPCRNASTSPRCVAGAGRWAARAHRDDPERHSNHRPFHAGKWHVSPIPSCSRPPTGCRTCWSRKGVRRGDRVAIVLPQRFETAVAYMAVLQMGAVAMPLSILFGPEALEFRLQDSEAVLAICDEASIGAVQGVRARCPQLRAVIGRSGHGRRPGRGGPCGAPPDFALVDTQADDPAVLIYTSGTTGNPKGALIPHRALIGNLSGFICSQNWFGFDPAASNPGRCGGRRVRRTVRAAKAVFWSPADWAWTGGLMDALLPTCISAAPSSPTTAASARAGVHADAAARRDAQLSVPDRAQGHDEGLPEPAQTVRDCKLQAIMSAGEAVGDAVFAYCRDAAGRDGQRDVRPDRDQLHRRQLCASGRPGPAAWARATRATASP
jgi:hypothetical protein